MILGRQEFFLLKLGHKLKQRWLLKALLEERLFECSYNLVNYKTYKKFTNPN